jgi:hypothetical protein
MTFFLSCYWLSTPVCRLVLEALLLLPEASFFFTPLLSRRLATELFGS